MAPCWVYMHDCVFFSVVSTAGSNPVPWGRLSLDLTLQRELLVTMASSYFSAVVFSLVLATLISAEVYPKPYTQPPYQSGPAAAPYPKGQSYPGGYEYQNGGYGSSYNYKSSSSRVAVESEADVLDRLFDIIDRIIAFEDFAAETLANTDSQQSVLKKQVTQLTILDLPALEEQNVVLSKRLDNLEKAVEDLEDLIDDLSANVDDLEYLNAENAKDIKDLEIALANEQFIDSTQVRDIASLLAAVQNLKTKLISIETSKFKALDNEIQKVVGQFVSTSDLETSRMCETGVTTLTADDRRNTVVFNTDFGGQVPQIEYGISGIKSRFVGEEPSKYNPYGKPYDPKYPPYGKPYDPKYPQYEKPYDPKYPQYEKPYDPKYPQYEKPYDPKYPQYGKPYDSKYPPYGSYNDRNPGLLGDLVVALATPESITFELVDAAFNVAESVSVEVAWNVCSVRPGTRLAKY
ncbi:uncharacterized protein LOC112561401 [Pomacea canaliculata]|uniref:uncharacterized protein LOC112561401 n=1 Tax=Pomacea canaliculata TaxID=400727 RepID=UPI000D737D05|nr:uncharacterized protein LOC112561401 [Pomacea canaliculata]